MTMRCVGVFGCAFGLLAAAADAGIGFSYVNETDLPEEADRAVLTGSSFIEFPLGQASPDLFGQVYEIGLTEDSGPAAQVIAQVGFGPFGSDPRFSLDWSWSGSDYAFQTDGFDEYVGVLIPSETGMYSFTFRFSIDGGATWTLADLDGAGSESGYTFDPGQLGQMNVVTPPAILDFTNFKTRFFTQTSASEPTSVVSYAATQRLFGDSLTPDSVGTAQVTFPGMEPPVFTLTDYSVGLFVSRQVGPFPTEAALDAEIPAGDYTYNVFGGQIGDGSGVITQPTENFWSNPPGVTNYAALQMLEPGNDVIVTYNTPVTDPAAADGGVFWRIFDPVAIQEIANGFNPFSGPHDFTVPASRFVANRTYHLSITFSARTPQTFGVDGMSSALGFTAWDSLTGLDIRVLPAFCQGDANRDGVVNFGDIASVLANFGMNYTPNSGPGDANADGAVDFGDIAAILANFGALCG